MRPSSTPAKFTKDVTGPCRARAHGSSSGRQALAAINASADLRDVTARLLVLIATGTPAESGDRDDALKIVEELKPVAETNDEALIRLAQVYIALEDLDSAFEWLEKAYQRRATLLRTLKTDFFYDPARSDPRFKDLLRRIGLPP